MGARWHVRMNFVWHERMMAWPHDLAIEPAA
jgi:hypothetical protein